MEIKTRWLWKNTSCEKRKLEKVTYESLQICGKIYIYIWMRFEERYIGSPDSMPLINSTPRCKNDMSIPTHYFLLLIYSIPIYSPIMPWLAISFLVFSLFIAGPNQKLIFPFAWCYSIFFCSSILIASFRNTTQSLCYISKSFFKWSNTIIDHFYTNQFQHSL